MSAPKKAAAPTAPPKPPRAIILMDAPTNTLVAGHFAKHGYSVEMILDLKYCSTPLLKSAKFIVLGPNSEDSPFYNKIKATLKKMVPDRLFEESGVELLQAVRNKVNVNIQTKKPSHPTDQQLKSQARTEEDKRSLSDIPPQPKEALPSNNMESQGIVSITLTQAMEHETILELSQSILKTPSEPNNFEINDELINIIEPYLKTNTALGLIDGQRTHLLLDEELPEDAAEEIKKQQGSIKKPLSPERVLQKAEQFQQQVKQAEEAGKEFPPRKLPDGELYDHVIELGSMADQLQTEKAQLRQSTASALAKNFCRDKFYKVISACGVNSDTLHGTLYLYLTLSTLRHQKASELKKSYSNWKSLYDATNNSSKPKKGLGGLFKKKKEEEVQEDSGTPELDEATSEISPLVALLSMLDAELSFFEKDLVDAYWNVYELTSVLILEDRIKNPTFLRYIRAFMRFGMICDHPSMISKAQSDRLLNMCDEDKSPFQHEAGQTNIVFPDECLTQIRLGIIPPSFDEELELEGQGTPKYKYDKAIRKIYASEYKTKVYGRERTRWQQKIDEQKSAQASADAMLAEHEKGTKEYKTVQIAVREARAEVSRISKIVEKLDGIIENENETIETQRETLNNLNYTLNPKELASNEAKTIRRFCKLLGNLKEFFFPFLLRDNFKLEPYNLFDRKVMSEHLSNFEKDDPTIFSSDLVNAQNPRKQVMIRFSPTIIIYPVVGSMGFCVAPSGSTDSGRLVLPLMGGTQAPLPRMMIDMFADFRYDTAKENAGVDLMTSDTICAAYAKVRWDYRKKGKEFREKAGIYNDMQDKKNFKVHYRLYIESMEESGKKLFFKCYEMYEGFVKYIPLPRDKQKLSKN
jgi:hypothetical protein